MNNREKVIEKYAREFRSEIVSTFDGSNYDISIDSLRKTLEKFLQEILIAESPQGPEDVEPKEEKIEEIKGWLKLRDSQPESIHVKMFYKINELVRRVNEGI